MKLHQWQDRKIGFTFVDNTKAKKFALKYIKDEDRILDIGCGDCILFDIISKNRKNCRLYGFDIIKEALEKCKAKGYNSLNSLYNVKIKFDVITMFECFEHLTYKERLNQVDIMSKLLKDGGYIILSFPNVRSMLSLIHYYDNPEHKTPYVLESNLLRFFYDYKIVDKIYFSPWLNPLKVLNCLITGLSFKSVYNNVCYVLREK